MRSILIATDTHADSDRALSRAVRLAVALGAKLTVVSVMEDTEENPALLLREGLVEDQLSAQPGADGLETEVVVAVGDPADEIAHCAIRVAADLVVMGQHHKRKFLDSLRQTTVEKILRKLTCPALLAVEPSVQDYTNVLASVDFSDACAASIAAARKLAPDADIRLMHVVQVPYQSAVAAPGAVGDISHMVDPTPFIEDARTRAEKFAPDLPTDLPTGSLHLALSVSLQDRPAQLICLGAHTKKGAIDTLLGSFTADLVRDPPSDLLIAPPPRATM
ncbi:MAG: universal stress protein [Dinoroseobacter sp.]|nr:universal stress protein [Dinoroseobacter sp.]